MRLKTKLVIGIAGLILMSAAVVFLLLASRLEEFTVKGGTYYNEETLKKLLKKNRFDDNAVLFYIRLKYGGRPKIPFIEEVDVDLRGLNALTVRVYEKDIVGCLPYMGEYVCFDKDGIMVGSITETRKDVPVIEGIAYQKIVFGKEIETGSPKIFANILNLTQLINKYKIPVDKIRFGRDMEVKLYCEGVRVSLGKRTHYDEQISNLGAIISKTKGMKGILHMEEFSSLKQRVIFEADKVKK